MGAGSAGMGTCGGSVVGTFTEVGVEVSETWLANTSVTKQVSVVRVNFHMQHTCWLDPK